MEVRETRALERFSPIPVGGDVFHTVLGRGRAHTDCIHRYDDDGDEFLKLVPIPTTPVSLAAPSFGCDSGQPYGSAAVRRRPSTGRAAPEGWSDPPVRGPTPPRLSRIAQALGEDVGMSHIPGIVAAVADKRTDDAVALIEGELELHPATSVVYETAAIGGFLHRHPELTLQEIAVQWELADYDDADHEEAPADEGKVLTNGELGLEVLAIMETMLTGSGGAQDPNLEPLLAPFDERGIGGELIRQVCTANLLLMMNMKLQMALPLGGKRSADAAQRYAFAHARAALTQSEEPNIFSAEWNDQDGTEH